MYDIEEVGFTIRDVVLKELKDQTKDQDFWWYYIDGDPTKDLERVADAILSWDSDIEIGFRSGANYEHI